MDLDDPSLDPFWAAAQELRAPIFIHPAGTTLGKRVAKYYLGNIIGNPLDTTIALTNLIFGGVLERFPMLNVVAAHGGGYLPSYFARSVHGTRFARRRTPSRTRPTDYLQRLWIDNLVFEPLFVAHLVNVMGASQDRARDGLPVRHGPGEPGRSDRGRAGAVGGGPGSDQGRQRDRAAAPDRHVAKALIPRTALHRGGQDPRYGVGLISGRAPDMATELSSRIARLKELASFEPRPLRPGFSGREPFDWPERLRENRQRLLDQAAEPFVGITTDGTALPGLYEHPSRPASRPRPLLDAADALLAALAPEQRATVSFDLDERRLAHLEQHLAVPGAPRPPPGALTDEQRELALGLLRATLSAAGYQTARDVMRLNHTIAEMTGGWDELRRVDVLDQPVRHAVRDRAVGLADRRPPPDRQLPRAGRSDRDDAVLHGLRAGAWPRPGKFAGTSVFEAEEERGYALMQALTPEQQAHGHDRHGSCPATCSRRPPATTSSCRTRAFASPSCRRRSSGCCCDLIETYIGRMRPGHAEVRLEEVQRHLGETYFAWIGACDDDERLLLPRPEPGHADRVRPPARHRASQNDEPTRAHIHTVVRTPNGNDYGKDLLRQHYARPDQSRR